MLFVVVVVVVVVVVGLGSERGTTVALFGQKEVMYPHQESGTVPLSGQKRFYYCTPVIARVTVGAPLGRSVMT